MNRELGWRLGCGLPEQMPADFARFNSAKALNIMTFLHYDIFSNDGFRSNGLKMKELLTSFIRSLANTRFAARCRQECGRKMVTLGKKA